MFVKGSIFPNLPQYPIPISNPPAANSHLAHSTNSPSPPPEKLEIPLSSHSPRQVSQRSPCSSPRPPGCRAGWKRKRLQGWEPSSEARLGAAYAAAMQSPIRRNAEGRPLGTCDPSSSGRFSHCRRQVGSEFQSLLSSRVPGADPISARLRLSEGAQCTAAGLLFPLAGRPQTLLPQLPEDNADLEPVLPGIALRSLLAIDLWPIARCRGEPVLGSMRPLMKLLEISGHGIPWLLGTLYCLSRSDSWAGPRC